MRVLPYFSPLSMTTTFVVFSEGSSAAIIVDPVHLDRDFYALLLAHKLEVDTVLVTHPEEYMLHALGTLGKIYNYRLVCGDSDHFPGTESQLNPYDRQLLTCAGLSVESIPILPHSRSSFIYRFGCVVFTGPIIHAGTLGDTMNEYTEELLVATVKDQLFSAAHDLVEGDRDMLILPSIGPPTTIRAEQHLSPYYRDRDTELD